MSIHAVKRAQSHLAWDNSIPPVLRVNSGETITFDCLDASNGQVTPATQAEHLATVNFASLDQVNGPIYVSTAEPGDTLQIDVLDVQTADWGWTGIFPGFGILADEFAVPDLKIWSLHKSEGEEESYGYAWFDKSKGIKVPLKPFAGEMGVAPGEKGAFSTIPPYRTGGNIDTKHLSKGSTLYLPIEAEGALFSVGDGHAAQGDGEVCGTAIETPMKITVRLTVLKNKQYVKTPHFQTPPITKSESTDGYYCTTGVDPDIREATRSAVRNMIAFLSAEYSLKPVESYMLCSVAGDLRMHEVVDMPNYVIGMMIPRSIFGYSP